MNAGARISIYEAQVIAPARAPATPEPPPAPTRKKRRAQAWLALHFNDWPLHAALDKLSPTQGQQCHAQPVAVLDGDRQRRVLACNDTAWQRGIRPGHTLNAAMALCAEVRLLSREVAHEMQLLEEVAAWAQRFTPCVSLEPPNELLLEVRGSFRLFGGATTLVERIVRELRERHIEARSALSPTARSALWLSRAQTYCFAPPRELNAKLAGVPIECLHWSEEMEGRLRRFGVRTLGQLARLPRADLARRIDARCLREWNGGLGRQADIRTQFNPPECYRDRILLDFEIETTALLETLLTQRLELLWRYLRERNLVLSALEIELAHRDGLITPLQLGLAAPTADMHHLAKLLHEKLLQLNLPAPVSEVRMQVQQLLAARGKTGALFRSGVEAAETLTRSERLERLLEQLRARLGDRAILTLQARADHRPEKAQQADPAMFMWEPPAAQDVPILSKRPTWLLREPRVLGVGIQVPDDWYVLEGPERIEAGWWDGLPIARDYRIAKSKQGVLAWLFRECATTTWYLHGLFG